MIIILHVLIALASLVYTGYLFFRPSQQGLRISYGLVAATVVSGTYLVVSTGAHMLQACTTGLVYLGITTVGILAARAKLRTNI